MPDVHWPTVAVWSVPPGPLLQPALQPTAWPLKMPVDETGPGKVTPLAKPVDVPLRICWMFSCEI